ncbi:MAG: DUF4189 domain-containing protein [Formosimonas sp.]
MLKKLVCALALCLSTGSVFAQVCGDGGQFLSVNPWTGANSAVCAGGSQGNRAYGTNVYDGVGPPVNNGGTGSGNGSYPAPQVINRYGAVAWNRFNNQFDSSFNEPSLRKAKQLALARCGKNCYILSYYGNQCVAVAFGLKPNKAGSYTRAELNTDASIAEHTALEDCNSHSNNCSIVLSECSK